MKAQHSRNNIHAAVTAQQCE